MIWAAREHLGREAIVPLLLPRALVAAVAVAVGGRRAVAAAAGSSDSEPLVHAVAECFPRVRLRLAEVIKQRAAAVTTW